MGRESEFRAVGAMNEPLNVARRVKDEQVLTERLIDLKQQGHAMRACEWYNARERGDVSLQQLYEKKKITNELEQANKEMLLLRRARMKELLEAEAFEFETQLNSMGLA